MALLYDDIENYLDWVKTKANLKFNSQKHKFPIYYNCIYWAHMGCNVGSEEGKHRPVLITRTYKNSPTVTVIPLTTQKLRDKHQFHVDLEKQNLTALCEQMRIIDIARIEKPMYFNGKIVTITTQDWKKIDFQVKREYLLCKPKTTNTNTQCTN